MPRTSRRTSARTKDDSDEDESYAGSEPSQGGSQGGGGNEDQVNLGAVLLQIKDMFQHLVNNQNGNQNQNQPPPPLDNNPVPPIGMQIQAAVARATANGGICGYEDERPLTQTEADFVTQMVMIGAKRESADELFRQGTTSNEDLRMLSPKDVQHFAYNLKKNISIMCPNISKIVFKQRFRAQLQLIVDWIEFQEIIGGPTTATEWLRRPDAAANTQARIKSYKNKKESKLATDTPMPDKLKTMRTFVTFDETFRAYCLLTRGSHGVPILYVLREEEEVTDIDRNGTVGNGPSDTYVDWDDYGMKCCQMTGEHWETDNLIFWTLLKTLVKEGPGWDYIRSFEKHGKGDGRRAYHELKSKAMGYTNHRMVVEAGRQFYKTASWTGPSKNQNFDQFVRSWYRNNETMTKYKARPPEVNIITDFVNSIHEPRIEYLTNGMCHHGSTYDTFDKAATAVLAHMGSITQKDKAKKTSTNISSTTTQNTNSNRNSNRRRNRNSNSNNTSNNTSDLDGKYEEGVKGSFTGKIEARSYPLKVWNILTTEQRQKIQDLRAEQGPTKKQKLAAAKSAAQSKADKEKAKSKTRSGGSFGSAAHTE